MSAWSSLDLCNTSNDNPRAFVCMARRSKAVLKIPQGHSTGRRMEDTLRTCPPTVHTIRIHVP
jgi:hypothetical protein